MATNKNQVSFDQIKKNTSARLGQPGRPGAPKITFNIQKDGPKFGFGPKPLLSLAPRRHPKGLIPIEVYMHHHVTGGKMKRWECDGIIAFAKHPKVNLPYATEKDFDAMVKIYGTSGLKGWEAYQQAQKAAAPVAAKEEKQAKSKAKEA